MLMYEYLHPVHHEEGEEIPLGLTSQRVFKKACRGESDKILYTFIRVYIFLRMMSRGIFILI